MSEEYDFSHLNEAERASLMRDLVQLRDPRNGNDPASKLRQQVKELKQERDLWQSRATKWQADYRKLEEKVGEQ